MTDISPRSEKTRLRHAAIARRKLIDPGQRERAGIALMNVIMKEFLRPTRPRTIAAYVSMGTEIPLHPTLEALLGHGMRVLVPRLGGGAADDVGWGLLTKMEDLQRPSGASQRRPDEPTGRRLPPNALESADLILVPAFAVDTHGTRLGRGGGWYDRALRHVPSGATIAGVCWPWERVATPLPREDHDVPMTAIVTPRDVTRIAPNQEPPAHPSSRYAKRP